MAVQEEKKRHPVVVFVLPGCVNRGAVIGRRGASRVM